MAGVAAAPIARGKHLGDCAVLKIPDIAAICCVQEDCILAKQRARGLAEVDHVSEVSGV